MNRLPKILSLLSTLLITVATLQTASGVDGFWTQTSTNGGQDFTLTGNWLSGIVAGGVNASAVINVDLPGDQNITNFAGQILGHLFIQDVTTSSAGGYNLGGPTDVGSITLDVPGGWMTLNTPFVNDGTIYAGAGVTLSVEYAQTSFSQSNAGILRLDGVLNTYQIPGISIASGLL